MEKDPLANALLKKKGHLSTEISVPLTLDQLQQAAQKQSSQIPIRHLKSQMKDDALRWFNCYKAIRNWIWDSLYFEEVGSLLWPIFIHSYLDLLQNSHTKEALHFFTFFSKDHSKIHQNDIEHLQTIQSVEQLKKDQYCVRIRALTTKFSVQISQFCHERLVSFMHENGLREAYIIINKYVHLEVVSSEKIMENTNKERDLEMDLLVKKHQYWGAIDSPIKKIKKEEDLHGDNNNNNHTEEQPKFLPLPKLSEEVQKKQSEDQQLRPVLGANSLPSICFFSVFHSYSSANVIQTSDSLIATGFSDSTIRVWNLKAGKSAQKVDEKIKSHKLIGHSGAVYGMSFSSDSQWLLSSGDDSIRLWNLNQSKYVQTYKGHNYPIWDVAFSPVGYYFASASHDRTARLWTTDEAYPCRIFAGHFSDVNCVKFHPNSSYVVTGSSDKTLRLWDINTGACVRLFCGHQGSVSTCAVSPCGKYLVSAADDEKVIFWDINTSKKMAEYPGHTGSVWSLDFSADGNLVASGAADNSVKLWDVAQALSSAPSSLGLLKSFTTRQTPVYHVKFTPRNLLLAAGPFS